MRPRLTSQSIAAPVALLVAVATARAARLGDVAPGGGDGRLSVADIVRTVALVETPPSPVPLALDLSPGDEQPTLVVPATWGAFPDDQLASGDLARLKDAVLGRLRLEDAPGIVAALGDPVAVRGRTWTGKLQVACDPGAPASWSLVDPPAGASLGPATGVVTFTADASHGPRVALVARATLATATHEARLSIEIVDGSVAASDESGPAGDVVEVTDEDSPLAGLRWTLPEGALGTVATVQVEELHADPGLDPAGPARAFVERSADTILGPLALRSTAPFSSSSVAWTVPPALVADAAAGRLEWEMLTPLALACSRGRSACDSPMPSQWIPVATQWSGGSLVALPLCGSEALLRVVRLPVPCEGPLVSGIFEIVAVDCPARWTLADVAADLGAFQSAFGAQGWTLPPKVRVRVGAGLDPSWGSRVASWSPDVLTLDSRLSRAQARLALAHDLFHVAQLERLQRSCFDARELAVPPGSFLVESTAAWMEEIALDGDEDPDGHEIDRGARLSEDQALSSLDCCRYRAWPFVNFLSTALAVHPDDLLGTSGAPGALVRMAAEIEARSGSFEDAFLDYLHELNVARRPERLREVDRFGLQPAPRLELTAATTEASPATSCVELPRASGASVVLDVAGDLDPIDEVVVRAIGDGAPAIAQVRAGDTELERETSAAILVGGAWRGTPALHVMNPSLDAAVATTVTIEAFVVHPDEIQDTDGDGWPDAQERETGSDPYDGASTPWETVIAAPPVLVALPGPFVPGQREMEVVVASPPVLVALPGSSVPGQREMEVVVAHPPVLVALPGPSVPGQRETEVVVAAPPVLVALPGPSVPGQRETEVVVATPPVLVALPGPSVPGQREMEIVVATPPVDILIESP